MAVAKKTDEIAADAAEHAAKPKKAKKPKKPKAMVTRGKRKEAIARAVATEGHGSVRINRLALDCFEPAYLREIISEPLEVAGDAAKRLDISVNVSGGGIMGQAEAVRIAIARAIAAFTGDDALRKRMQEYDRFMLVEDSRRVEPKKYLGPKARARGQKSYR